MKKQLIIFLQVLFTSSFLFSQNINQEYVFSEKIYVDFYSGINIDDKTFLGGSIGSCKFGSLAIFTSQGEMVSHDSIKSGYWNVEELEFREIDSIIIGSGFWLEADDYNSPNDGPYVFGLDLEGNKLFENNLPNLGFSIWNVVPTTITYTDDNEIILAAGSLLVWLDSIGQFQDSIDYNLNTNFIDVEKLENNQFLAYSKDKLLLLNSVGVILNSIESTVDILDVYYDSTHVYCLRENDLLIYEISSENIIYTANYLSSINAPKRIVGNNLSLFLYEKNGYPVPPGNDQVVQLDKSDLSIVDDFVFYVEDTHVSFVIASENDLQIIGQEENYKSFIKSKSINSELIFDNIDVSIINLTILDTLEIIDSMQVGVNEYTYELAGANEVRYEFEVYNNSNDAITNFSIVGVSYTGTNCAVYRYLKHFENISIPPNTSMVFTDTSFVEHIFFNTLPSIYAGIFAPNHKFDFDRSNNSDFDQVVITNTEEINSVISSWDISPNPANDYILFNASLISNPKGVNISIYNSQGRKIITKIFNPQGNIINEKIVINHLPNGIYWLSIHTLNDVQAKSFVVVK